MSSEAEILKAAQFIQNGQLVVMPTETVYGLAADATNANAVEKIFVAKGRPVDNPLIVHVSRFSQVAEVSSQFPEWARDLVSRFWPGPLTLVLPKSDLIPDITTAGLDSVAVRMPSHPMALALIEASGRPLAAPSANLYMGISPTRVEHLSPEIRKAVAMVLDGGPCEVGIESTVVDATGDRPVVLRFGVISALDIEETVGRLGELIGDSIRSPGQHPRHYSPRARLVVVDRISGVGIGFGPAGLGQVQLPRDPLLYAQGLYAALHQLDSLNPDEIQIEAVPDETAWDAVRDRVRRASQT